MRTRIDQQAQQLADSLDSLDKRISGVEGKSDLAFSSIEDGQIQEKDLDGNLVASVGKQFDGSHVAVPYTGPKPATPVAATLKASPGNVEVRWNGKFTDAQVSSLDFKHAAVHASRTPMVDATPSTQVATIRGEMGDVATLILDSGTWYFALVAWTTAGKASEPSAIASVVVPEVLDTTVVEGLLASVQESVNGKNSINNSTEDPTPGEHTEDDKWQKWDTLEPGGALIASWRYRAGTWVQESLDPTYLPLVDIGQGTFGSLGGGRLEADAIDGMTIKGVTVEGATIFTSSNPGEVVSSMQGSIATDANYRLPGIGFFKEGAELRNRMAGMFSTDGLSLSLAAAGLLDPETFVTLEDKTIEGVGESVSLLAGEGSGTFITPSAGLKLGRPGGSALNEAELRVGTRIPFAPLARVVVRQSSSGGVGGDVLIQHGVRSGNSVDFSTVGGQPGKLESVDSINGYKIGTSWVKLALASGWSDYTGGGGYRAGLWARISHGNLLLNGMVVGGNGRITTIPTALLPLYTAEVTVVAAGAPGGARIKGTTADVPGAVDYRYGPSNPGFVSINMSLPLA